MTCLHKSRYKWKPTQNKTIKIVPNCIELMFSSKSLAHWVMDDGYFDSYGCTQAVIFCTESFAKEESVIFQNIFT